MQQLCTGAARRKFFIGLTHAAAAGGGKGNNRFTFQIVAFQKCIDDGGSNIPPDRETDKDGVILVHVIAFGGDGFLLYYKRLEGGSFELPTFNPNTGNYEISYQVLSFILNGVSLKSVRLRKRFRI